MFVLNFYFCRLDEYNLNTMNEVKKAIEELTKFISTTANNFDIIEKELMDIKERIAFLERELNK